VAAALDDVAAGVALAEPRRDERAAHERHADLPAVEVAGDGQRDAVGHLREQVRVVAEQDGRRVVGNVPQGAFDVRRLVAEVLDAGDPHVARAARLVLQHRDSRVAESRAHAGAVVAPVVVAEDRDDPERRPQPAEPRRHGRRRDARSEADLGIDVVAEQQDEVRRRRVHRGGDALDPLLADVRRAGVQVGDERDAQAVERGRPPLTEVELALADAVAPRLLPQRAPGDRGRDESGGGREGGTGTLHALRG